LFFNHTQTVGFLVKPNHMGVIKMFIVFKKIISNIILDIFLINLKKIYIKKEKIKSMAHNFFIIFVCIFFKKIDPIYN
jgi:hypothetical protein